LAPARLDLLGCGHRHIENRLELERLRVEIARQGKVVHRQQVSKLFREPLGVLQILHAQRTARDLVLIGRPDALAGGADLAGTAVFSLCLACLVDLDMERQDERARLADEQA
jgi:hypothetical protein